MVGEKRGQKSHLDEVSKRVDARAEILMAEDLLYGPEGHMVESPSKGHNVRRDLTFVLLVPGAAL